MQWYVFYMHSTLFTVQYKRIPWHFQYLFHFSSNFSTAVSATVVLIQSVGSEQNFQPFIERDLLSYTMQMRQMRADQLWPSCPHPPPQELKFRFGVRATLGDVPLSTQKILLDQVPPPPPPPPPTNNFCSFHD